VADGDYDRACALAEAWEADRLARAEKLSRLFCPSCGCAHLEYIGAATFGGSAWKCTGCGNSFAR